MKDTVRFRTFLFMATAAPLVAQGKELSGECLYQVNCASFHGVDLEGQPDWHSRLPNIRLPAPPHDASGHTRHHPGQVLIDIATRGAAAIVGSGYESYMPGFEGVLPDKEILPIVKFVTSTWPEQVRATQHRRTTADEKARQ